MSLPRVIHLIDDTTAGGVMRVLQHISTSPEMARTACHTVLPVRRGALSFRRIDADVIVSHLSVSWRALPGLIALRAIHPDLPLIHVEHSYTEAFTAQNVQSRSRFFALLRTAYALFDRVVAVSEGQGRWLTEQELVPGKRMSVIPSTVDLADFAALPAPSSPARVFGAIGRLDRQKGFDVLIEAFRACPDPDVRLRIVGDGSARTALEGLADGDPRIAFTGAVSDPVAAMASVDAVVMPSRWEAYGLVALEARAAGRPLLVSGVDGLADHVDQGAIGVDELSADAWAIAIAALASRSHGAKVGRPTRKGAADSAQDAFVTGWAKLLEKVVAPAAGPAVTATARVSLS